MHTQVNSMLKIRVSEMCRLCGFELPLFLRQLSRAEIHLS